MTTPSPETCAICGQPKSTGMTGSFTQWVSMCRCEFGDKSSEHLPICALCGKQIAEANTGSFTQWVLSENCTCDNPMPLDSDSDPRARVTTSGTESGAAPRQPRKTLADIQEDSFPLERYKPLDKLGAGGSGSVYLCFDKHLRKNVAVKITKLTAPDQVINFQSEAKVTARFKHPNIVSIIDFGLTSSGAPFMVLEYVDGVSLDKLIQLHGPMAELEALDLFVQIASALQKGHESGIFHRDIKSSNIIITQDSRGVKRAQVIDFGIALMSGQETTAFQGKDVIGTPKYMAPDLLLGKSFDARTEVYSFGCVMFETLTGSLPFHGDALVLLEKHCKQPPPSFEEIDPELDVSPYTERVVQICLAKEPAERFRTMKELVIALESARNEEVIASSSVLQTLSAHGLAEPVPDANSASEKKKKSLPDHGTGAAGSSSAAKPGKIKLSLVVTALVAVILFGAIITGLVWSKRSDTMIVDDTPADSDSDQIPNQEGEFTLLEAESRLKEFNFKSLEDYCTGGIKDLEENDPKGSSDKEAKRTQLYRLRGLARQYQGNYDEAETDFDTAIELSSDRDLPILRARAKFYGNCLKFNEAFEDIDHALKRAPRNVDNLTTKAQILILNETPDQNQIDELARVTGEAVELAPENGLCFALKSVSDYRKKEYVGASENMTRAGGQAPHSPEVLYYSGYWEFYRNNLDHARRLLNQAIKLSPAMWEAYYYQAQAFATSHDYETSIEYFNKASRLNPKNHDLYYKLGFVCKEAKKPDQALAAIDKAIKLQPKDHYFALRAELNHRLDNNVETVSDCDELIKRGKRDASIYRYKGLALFRLDKLAGAEEALTKAIALDSHHLSAYLTRAKVYSKLEKHDKAIADCTKYISLCKDPVTLREVLSLRAAEYRAIGQADLAEKDEKEAAKVWSN